MRASRHGEGFIYSQSMSWKDQSLPANKNTDLEIINRRETSQSKRSLRSLEASLLWLSNFYTSSLCESSVFSWLSWCYLHTSYYVKKSYAYSALGTMNCIKRWLDTYDRSQQWMLASAFKISHLQSSSTIPHRPISLPIRVLSNYSHRMLAWWDSFGSWWCWVEDTRGVSR